MNQKEWAKLPPEYQAIFTAAAKEAEVGMLAKYDAQIPYTKRILEQGIQMPLAQDIMSKAFEVAQQPCLIMPKGSRICQDL